MSYLCRIAAYLGFFGSLIPQFPIYIKVFSGEHEKESILCVGIGKKNLSLAIIVCHHSASLVMPTSDHWDKFFYHTLTLMMDSCNILYQVKMTLTTTELVYSALWQ